MDFSLIGIEEFGASITEKTFYYLSDIENTLYVS
jgi:hypothetical protein